MAFIIRVRRTPEKEKLEKHGITPEHIPVLCSHVPPSLIFVFYLREALGMRSVLCLSSVFLDVSAWRMLKIHTRFRGNIYRLIGGRGISP